MLPSAEYVRATYNFEGAAVPNGAAIVCCHLSDPVLEADETADLLQTIFVAEVMPQMALQVTLTSVDVKMGPDDTGAIGTSSGAAVSGSNGADVAAPNTSYLVKKLTATGGRRYRGRLFLPGVGETSVGPGGIVTPTRIGELQGAMSDWLTSLDGNLVGLHLEHGPKTEWVIDEGGQPRRVPVAGTIPIPTVVTTLQVQSVVATQRRRLR